ncbi:sporulation histidine kinase inhibitor Sda [Cytobacillus gottheilii]|nr:sporulation histidine kinase inhibitor Sda [Cytobacillus gottheilii]
MSNEELIEAYQDAIRLELDEDFIAMLAEEMIRRNIKIVKKNSVEMKS